MVKYFCTLFAFMSAIPMHGTALHAVGSESNHPGELAWFDEEPPYVPNIPTIEDLVAMEKILTSAIEDGQYAPHVQTLRSLRIVLERGITMYRSHFNPELFLRYNTPRVLRIQQEMSAILGTLNTNT